MHIKVGLHYATHAVHTLFLGLKFFSWMGGPLEQTRQPNASEYILLWEIVVLIFITKNCNARHIG